MTSADEEKLQSSMSSPKPHDAVKPSKSRKKKKKNKEVADSWENADESSSAEEAGPQSHKPSRTPSPIRPIQARGLPTARPLVAAMAPDRRPEKTDAVARRMIAAGLGLKAPKQTAEQSAYQKSIREQERKRRDQQRAEEQERKEEAEKAKAAIWND
ncbi:ubiquitin-like protein smt3 [Ophiocordyceps camponoti-floridani]|uniref:Ubiquitin-like protein smt3 n=1 Tax=Ophiocordyceps camponoti-floridani TaxID=2030778 RepID=A0A8H4VFQ6_9HYPO|nr:ubiquitin-like protein smt3 [Ophiocordyceps camponoti-floridani]